MLGVRKMMIPAGLGLAALLVGCFTEDSGECSAGAPCPNRGEACNDLTNTCELVPLSVDGTEPSPAPTDFTRTIPFFRGNVCMPTAVQPGDAIPVKVSMCYHPCVDVASYQFKTQYRCNGASCESALIVYAPGAVGMGCPADVFGKFAKTDCLYLDVNAKVGPFTITSTGDVTGTATVELPFLTNDDAATIHAGATIDQIWDLIYKYPQDKGRVFNLSMNAGNPAAPADCSGGGCTCKDIGF